MARRRRGNAPQYSPILAFTTPETASRGQYSGFGTDPNFIYSFRSPQRTPAQMASIGTSFMDNYQTGQLQSSLAYQQAGMEGKKRMEKLVGMGLPANTDINKVQQVGYDVAGRRPVFAAPRPQPFGTFGSIGMNNDEEQPVSLPQAPAMPSGGPQPAQGMTPPPIVPDRSLGITSNQFTNPVSMSISGLTERPNLNQISTSPLLSSNVPEFPKQYENIEMFTPYGTLSTRRQRI
jgi:hypothetical protein